MNAGTMIAGLQSEECFRSEMGVGLVGSMVLGDSTYDVGDTANGVVCSVVQDRKSMDDFHPIEMLDFVNQLALSSVNVEHENFAKNKATALAYRKAVYEEFDETYAQAFVHELDRPHEHQEVNQPPKLATQPPLSGPMVIGDVFRQGKSSGKLHGSKDHANKNHYLFEQEAGEASSMNSGNMTAGLQSEDCFRSEVEVGHVGSMTALGDFGNFGEGAVSSVVQIMKSRDDFQPIEVLDFVNQLALSSVNVEQENFIKKKGTALAYRKALYEEFDETYAQAVGHDPERPRKQQHRNQPPKPATPAPLSGHLVIGKVLHQGRGCAKAQKSKDHEKKDHCSVKQRGEPYKLKSSAGVHGGEAEGSLEIPSSKHALQKIRKSMDDFHPMEMLDFVNQLALSSVNVEHKDFAKEKATALAYRKAVYEEFDETYVQAFVREPDRPHEQQEVNQQAPLSGQRKGSEKSHESKNHANEDRYLFEQGSGEASSINAVNMTAGLQSKECFRSKVEVGHVGSTTVLGDSRYDVGDSTNGVVQIRKSIDGFHPMEMLDFVNQLALSSVNVEHEDFAKKKAAALAYRKAVYEEFDETYAQAFVREPDRRHEQQEVNQPPKLATQAPLSGHMVIGKVLRQGKGYVKAEKFKDHAKKDHCLFKQRGEPNDFKTSAGVHGNEVEGSFETPTSGHALLKNSSFISNPRQEAGYDFLPMEMLDFVNQLALSSVNVEHEDFVKKKAAALAYRKAVYEEFNETYAQAFVCEPDRPYEQQEVNQPPEPATQALLSGHMLIGKVLRQGKGYAKAQKSEDHAKKDQNLFEQRGEPSELETSAGAHDNVDTSSEQAEAVNAEVSKKGKVLVKHQQRERSARCEVSNPRQEAGVGGGVTTVNKTSSHEQQDLNQPPALLNTRAWIIKSSSESSEFISDPQFVEDHLNNLDEFRDCLFLFAPDTGDAIHYYSLNGLLEIDSLDIPERFSRMMFEFVADVDGLVCILFNGDNATILNPILQEWTVPSEIPQLPLADAVTQICYAFGKDIDGDYKILRFRERLQSRKNKAREIAVFSSSTRSWSVTCQRVPNNVRHMCHGVCVVGMVYLLCTSVAAHLGEDLERSVVSAMDLSDLTSAQLDLPGLCSEEHSCIFLFSLHVNLGLVQIVKEAGRSWNRIWSLQDDSSWEVMFKFRSDDWGSIKRYLPVRNQFVMMEVGIDGNLLVYLLDANDVRHLERRLKIDLSEMDCICTCLASLVPPS
ncbi:hypothetical protein AgCh_010596 [Apium graveolens]